MKRFTALILVVTLVFSLFIPCASAAERTFQDIPIITVAGTSNCWIMNADNQKVMPDDFDISTILSDDALVKELLAECGKAMLTNKWDTYCDKLVETVLPIWEQQKCDKNGDAQPGQKINRVWSEKTINAKKSDYNEGDYYYNYDWRLDPYESADGLHEYIKAVLKVTGKNQVGLAGRCAGSCVLAAYLDKYGDENLIDTTILYCPTVLGLETLEAVFTGDIAFEKDTVAMYANYYLNYQKPIEDEDVTGLLTCLVQVMKATGALSLTGKALECFLGKFKDNILPRILRESYGSMPGYFAMISSEKLETAISYIFGGVEDEYAGLIGKVRNYSANAQTNLFRNIDSLIEKYDMNIIVIAKYGTPTYPYFSGSNYQSDNSNSVQKQSLGATAAAVDSVLPSDYIENAKRNGTDKYISADGKIDASTCYYPDNTWFFKDVNHTEHHPFVKGLMTYAVRCTDQLTVWNDPGTTQFMRRNAEGVFVTVPADDESDAKWQTEKPVVYFFRMFKYLFRVINTYVKKAFAKK